MVDVKLTLSEFNWGTNERLNSEAKDFGSASTQEMQIQFVPDRGGCICSDYDFSLPLGVTRAWSQYLDAEIPYRCSVIFTIEIIVSDKENPVAETLRIFLDTFPCDLVIVAAGGEEIECYKCILVAYSPVMKAMIESGLEESRSGRIEMVDMTENGVKALLQYFYSRDLSQAIEDPEIAFELLNCTEKYDIKEMKTFLEELFIAMCDSWWTANVALKMFFFVKKVVLKSGKALLKRVIEIMKKNVDGMKQTEEFQRLFSNDPKSAMEFCIELLKYSPD